MELWNKRFLWGMQEAFIPSRWLFWEKQGIFSRIPGVEETTVVCQWPVETTSYQLRETDHAETGHKSSDPDKKSPLRTILLYYFHYWSSLVPRTNSREMIEAANSIRAVTLLPGRRVRSWGWSPTCLLKEEATGRKIAVGVGTTCATIPGGDYLQDYLRKNHRGYCHIDVTDAEAASLDWSLQPIIRSQIET